MFTFIIVQSIRILTVIWAALRLHEMFHSALCYAMLKQEEIFTTVTKWSYDIKAYDISASEPSNKHDEQLSLMLVA